MPSYNVVVFKRNGQLEITKQIVEKTEALSLLRGGGSVYAPSKRRAHTLADALSEGGPPMKHKSHLKGGYKHYHGEGHGFDCHIFYGRPSQ